MGVHRGFEASSRFLTGHRTDISRTEFPIWALTPTPYPKRAVYPRRVGHCQQLGWFGSSKISPTSGSAKDTQAVGTGTPLTTHQSMG